MYDYVVKRLTNKYSHIPLFYVTFNLNKYKENGAKGSCDLNLHPDIRDEYVIEQLNNLVDYIRENYDMEELSK